MKLVLLKLKHFESNDFPSIFSWSSYQQLCKFDTWISVKEKYLHFSLSQAGEMKWNEMPNKGHKMRPGNKVCRKKPNNCIKKEIRKRATKEAEAAALKFHLLQGIKLIFIKEMSETCFKLNKRRQRKPAPSWEQWGMVAQSPSGENKEQDELKDPSEMLQRHAD